MKPSVKRTSQLAFIFSIAALASCASPPRAPMSKDEKQGYFADPSDFVGVNFKPGRPSSEDSLSVALSSTRDQEALESDLVVLKRMPTGIRLRVLGFTDSMECAGTSCSDLALRRAHAVHDWFVKHGVPSSRFFPPYGFGSARPIGDNETEDGRARNRRAYISYEGQ